MSAKERNGAAKARTEDPDETEGRKLYRDYADTLAAAQVAYAKRRVRLRETEQ